MTLISLRSQATFQLLFRVFRSFKILGYAVLITATTGFVSHAQSTLYSEQFATDGDGSRYSVVGKGFVTTPLPSNPAVSAWERSAAVFASSPTVVSAANGWKVLGDPSPFPGINLSGSISSTAYLAAPFQEPVFSSPTIVAVEQGATLLGGASAPNRRVGFMADDQADETQFTADYLTLLDSTVNWAGRNQAGMKIGFVNRNGDGSTQALDRFDRWMFDRLASQGHTLVNVPQNISTANLNLLIQDPTDPVDLLWISDDTAAGALGNFWAPTVTVPIINYEYAAYTQMGVATGGANTAFTQVNISDPTHPIASGLTGIRTISNIPQAIARANSPIAPGGVVVASADLILPGVIDTLADADALKAGTLTSTSGTKSISQADILDLGTAPFGRWAFDNFAADPPIFNSNNYALFNTGTLAVTQAGTYYFAISGSDGGRLRIDTDGNGFSDADNVIVDNTVRSAVQDAFGSITLQPGNYNFEWTNIHDTGDSGWELSVAVAPAASTGPFSGSPDYFIGSDLNKTFGGGPPRSLKTPTIGIANVPDKSTLTLSVDLAARNLGWNADDNIRILVDPDAEGPEVAVLLTEFNGASLLAPGALSDGVTTLNEAFQTVNIPLGAANLANRTQIQILVEAFSTSNDETLAFDNILLKAVTASLPGDYNGNGLVDAPDYTVWRDGGSPDSSQAGYLLWKNNFSGFGSSVAIAGVVPEPSAWLVLVLGSTLWGATRRLASSK